MDERGSHAGSNGASSNPQSVSAGDDSKPAKPRPTKSGKSKSGVGKARNGARVGRSAAASEGLEAGSEASTEESLSQVQSQTQSQASQISEPEVKAPEVKEAEPTQVPAQPTHMTARVEMAKIPVDPQAQLAADSVLDQVIAQIPAEHQEEFKRAMLNKLGGGVPVVTSVNGVPTMPADAEPMPDAPVPAEPSPTAPATPSTMPAPAPAAAPTSPAPATAPAAPVAPAKPVDLKKYGVKQKFSAKLPEGYTPENPGLLYSPLANVDLKTGEPRVLEGLAVDTAQWGGLGVIVFLPGTDVRCLLPDGSVFDNIESESVERAPIVIPIDGDSTKLAQDLAEDQDNAIVAAFVPSFPQTIADGTTVIRHLVGRGDTIPKKGIWPRE